MNWIHTCLNCNQGAKYAVLVAVIQHWASCPQFKSHRLQKKASVVQWLFIYICTEVMSVNALPHSYFVLSTLLQELWSPWCPFSYFILSMLSSVLPAFNFILSHLTFGQSIIPIWLMFMMSCGCMCVCIRCPHEQNTLCKLQAEASAFDLYQGMQNIVMTTIYIM